MLLVKGAPAETSHSNKLDHFAMFTGLGFTNYKNYVAKTTIGSYIIVENLSIKLAGFSK